MTRLGVRSVFFAVVLVGMALVPALPAGAADTITGTGTAVSTNENSSFTGQTASFTDSNPAATAASLAATINWGDGVTTAGTVAGPNGGPFTVTGTHTYADELSTTVTTTITSATGTGTAASAANVGEGDNAVTLASNPITPTEGTAFNGQVGTWATSYQGDRHTDFTVTIDWGDGTITPGTLTFTGNSGGSGNYNITGTHTYLDECSCAFKLTVADDPPSSLSLQVQNSSTVGEGDSGTLFPVTFSATEGASFSGPVLNFNDVYANSPNDFTATINWGDGIVTAGTVTSPSAGNFTVSGTHTYSEEGTFTTGVTFADDTPSTLTVGPVAGTAKVADAALSAHGGFSLSGVESTTATNGVVAQFTDADPNAALGDFAALINWGDGTTTLGTITSNGAGGFNVSGSHTYNEEGGFSVIALVCDTDNGTVGFTGTCPAGRATATTNGTPSTVSVSDAPLTASGRTFSVTEGATFNGIAATFNDADTFRDAGTLGDYSATINWGDGTTTTGTVANCVPADNCTGTLKVLGTHAYADEGSFAVVVTLNDSGGSTATIQSTANVSETDVLTPTGTPVSATEGAAFTGQTASFATTFTGAIASGFTATINWGDGTTTAGTVTGPQGGPFTVTGTHTFADEGSSPVSTTLTDNSPGTATATANSTATIADATLSATPTTSTEAAGFPFTTTVANLTDANPLATTADFTATIDWGDGTATSAGTFSGPTGGPFSVSGSHTYAAPASYAVTVTINDDGGQTAIAHSTINVPLTCPPGATVISGNQGTVIISSNSNTCLNNASTTGSVIVQPGATATIVNSSIGGSVSSSSAASFAMCNSTTGGGVNVSGTTGDTTIGDDTELCPGNTIHGSLNVSNNKGGLEANANSISGSATFNSNLGSSGEDAVPEIEQNSSSGGLSCSGNSPQPTNDGLANSAPSKTGQCASL